MPEARLLVVDDEPNIVELLSASPRSSSPGAFARTCSCSTS